MYTRTQLQTTSVAPWSGLGPTPRSWWRGFPCQRSFSGMGREMASSRCGYDNRVPVPGQRDSQPGVGCIFQLG